MNVRWIIVAMGFWAGCSGVQRNVDTPPAEAPTEDTASKVVWSVVPSAIRYDEASKMVFVEAEGSRGIEWGGPSRERSVCRRDPCCE